MANPEHLAIIKQGVEVWNHWRKDNPDIKPNLRNASLKNLNLASINFSDTDLRGTKFNNTVFVNANFSRARIGLDSKLFITALLAIVGVAAYFYRFSFLFAFTVYLIALLLCVLRNFTANNKPYLPHNEKLVSKSELKLWKIHNINDHLNRKELISGLRTSINHLIHVSLFNFILLIFIAAWLEPKLRIFYNNEMFHTLIVCSAIIVVFYMGFLGTIGFDINKILRWLFFSIVPTSKFYNADLTDADFSFAKLTNADFRQATLIRTNLYKVQGIKQIEISSDYFYILKPFILNLILYHDAKNLDLEEVNLSNLNLCNTDFSDSNLKNAQLTSSNLAGSTLTGACIEDWNINSKTNLDYVICDYIYLKQNQQERRPHNPNQKFVPEEFSKLFKQVTETVDLVFSDGISW